MRCGSRTEALTTTWRAGSGRRRRKKRSFFRSSSPRKRGTQRPNERKNWIPAFAGIERSVSKAKAVENEITRPARRDTRAARKAGAQHRTTLPAFVPPQLATLSDKAPNSRDLVHEVKFDGYRMQARLENGKVKLLTRKALDWAHKFRPVADAVAQTSTPMPH